VRAGEPAWHLYVIRHHEPDRLAAALGELGIGTKAYYRVPIHRQEPMLRLFGPGPDLPGTDAVAPDHLAIPMGPALTERQVSEVVAAVASSV
jgi:dTDP-4-amino-4,6-dideoxygalactose transaminase